MTDKTEHRKYSLKINPPTLMEVMTLRDYFAAKAMHGILSNNSMIDTATESTFEWVAKNAYHLADAMLKARGEQ